MIFLLARLRVASWAAHMTSQASSTARTTPLLLRRRDVIAILGSIKLVQRMLFATAHGASSGETWLEEVRPDGRTRCRLYTRASVERAYARLRAGDYPALLPSELRRQTHPPRAQTA